MVPNLRARRGTTSIQRTPCSCYNMNGDHPAASWMPLCERAATKTVELQDLRSWKEKALLRAQNIGFPVKNSAGKTTLKDLEVCAIAQCLGSSSVLC